MGANAFDGGSTVGGSGKFSMGSSIIVESSSSERSEMSELLSKVRLHILPVLVSLSFDSNLRHGGKEKWKGKSRRRESKTKIVMAW